CADAAGSAGIEQPRGRAERSPGDAGLADAEQLHALRLALSQMPEADQHIIHLRHNAGLSFKEIADVLEQPLGTVLARQHRALKKLAELLKQAMERPCRAAVRREAIEGGDSPELAAELS